MADQCTRRTRTRQAAVTLAELEPALEEIGTVQVPGAATVSDQAARATTRPLQQVSEGVVGGVCQGLARYFGLNVTALRVFAVLLLFPQRRRDDPRVLRPDAADAVRAA